MSFGENLISLRKQMGWSQDDLANNLNLSRQAISKWENDTSKPDIDNVKKISKIFSVTIDDLLNNEVPKEKAVALDVKKEEKKERTITIVKLMIIAVIVLYVISVIYKFASLLIIVNGVQKYANLSNYHYVITTYENNEFMQKEEYWFKEGVSKNVDTIIENEETNNIVTKVDFNNKTGVIRDENSELEKELDIDEYLLINGNINEGGKFFSQLPNEIRKNSFIFLLGESINMNKCNIDIKNNSIKIDIGETSIIMDKETFLPIFVYQIDKNTQNNIVKTYEVELNCVVDI